MIDDQQNNTNKQGLTPSPSNPFPSSNTNADNKNGLNFLMVPGQNAHMSSFSSGKNQILSSAHSARSRHIIRLKFFSISHTLMKPKKNKIQSNSELKTDN